MRLGSAGGLVLVLLPLFAACGGAPSSLPDAPPCPTPTPGAITGFSTNQRIRYYTGQLQDGVAKIEERTSDFRAEYPSKKLGRKEPFRNYTVNYIDDVSCIAAALIPLTAPVEGFTDFDQAIDAALADLIETMAIGREALRQRNVSRYDEFSERLDAWPAKVDEAFAKIRGGRQN